MTLSPMRFKSFIWPHNPRVYTVVFERKMAVNKIPFGLHCLQSLGQTRRVLKGEGEFVGPGAYDTFRELATVFYEETPGTLIHPVWMSTEAWFVGLRAEEEPREDYVRYSFEFWESQGTVRDTLTTVGTQAETAGDGDSGAAVWYTVARGDTLWALAGRFDTSVAELVALNPEIRNPNLIYVGEEVRVR